VNNSFGLLLIAGAVALGPASAAVTDVASNGFTLGQAIAVSAPPDRVYAALVEPAGWWSADHTFSGSAANMSLDARAGGCFCEKLPGGGSVQHLTVLSVAPGKSLRLAGMLGPFQAVAGSGVMSFTLTPDKAGTTLEMTYQIAGYANMKVGGNGYEVWSKAADGMLSEQLQRLKHAVETGSPGTKP
jgi:uncharacterized protein YndB with AHSA1/START domain